MNDDWKSVRLREAEASLDVALATLDATLASVEKQFADKPQDGLSDEDIKAISEHARGADAPQALRDLQARIDAGELTWRDITSGRAAGEPGVREALESGLPQLRQAYALLEEGHSVDEVIEAGRSRSGRSDDDGDEGIVLREDAW
ncbi:hypothetical protein SAMN05192558_113210 [Actinokineospora alba]|uniref:Uncharacterized protein n=1 Tax=Actinokineospora alba TaxID=504798 RepID=A0A1H0VDQ8_9PSEU|nr:hypothetical protein [Actinokineospora alba]TDP65657.1 hypothetical protein C8E96_1144 [Actinokineospora alba]SDH67671.1 hypothetical protein SAMN05421871_101964 [Actinokineospora alba]SDP76483.1 hypothetical protein SAMN05192558_113210 [Actinokineospora alba]